MFDHVLVGDGHPRRGGAVQLVTMTATGVSASPCRAANSTSANVCVMCPMPVPLTKNNAFMLSPCGELPAGKWRCGDEQVTIP
jgi:hypothetical protein